MSDFISLDEKTKRRISEGIENNRKGDFSISFKDKNNKSIDLNNLDIKFVKHDFEFGINIYMINGFEEKWKNKIYEEKLTKLFNTATLPFYWNWNEPIEGQYRFKKDSIKHYRRPAIDECLEFCNLHNLKPRLHGLAYERFFPDWLKGKDDNVVKEKLDNRMKLIAEIYKEKIPLIEVTNEMHWENGNTSYYKDENYISDCFKMARKYFNNNHLIINEAFPEAWPILKDDKVGVYFNDIKKALSSGAHIDEIQFQFHMFFKDNEEYLSLRNKFYRIDHLLEICDKYSEFNLPLGISEMTIPSYLNNEISEDEQASVLETLYRTFFSHKNIHHITYWNLVDGTADTKYGDLEYGENHHHGGLLRFDMTEKKAYKVLDKLINEEWTTNLFNVSTRSGMINFRGFYGVYDIIYKNKKYRLNLTPKNKDAILKI